MPTWQPTGPIAAAVARSGRGRCNLGGPVTSPIGRENRGPGNRGHCNRVTESGKAIWKCGATWRIRLNGLTSFNPTNDIHTEFHRHLICRFDVMISALLRDYRKMTYPITQAVLFLECGHTETHTETHQQTLRQTHVRTQSQTQLLTLSHAAFENDRDSQRRAAQSAACRRADCRGRPDTRSRGRVRQTDDVAGTRRCCR